jgi:hypothetical protein
MEDNGKGFTQANCYAADGFSFGFTSLDLASLLPRFLLIQSLPE